MMRKIIAAAGGTIALVLVTASPALAATEVNLSVPIQLSVFVPCANGGNGEIVNASGNLHVLETFTINANTVSGVSHFQPQGITGTGAIDGVKYQGTGVTDTTFSISLQNGQAQETFVNRFDFIGQGSGNNLSIHETLHITFNANGTLTAAFDNFSLTCS